MKNNFFKIVSALGLVALISSSSISQMGRSSGSSFSSRSSYSSPHQSSGFGMGRSGGFNQRSSSTSSGFGMGRTGGFNQSPAVSAPSTSSPYSRSRAESSVTTSSARRSSSYKPRVYSIGSKPTTRYERTVVVDGRTRYVYSDGSYAWAAGGAIVGYLAQQNAYNRGYSDAQRYPYNNQPVDSSGLGSVLLGFVLFLLAVAIIAFILSASRLLK